MHYLISLDEVNKYNFWFAIKTLFHLAHGIILVKHHSKILEYSLQYSFKKTAINDNA